MIFSRNSLQGLFKSMINIRNWSKWLFIYQIKLLLMKYIPAKSMKFFVMNSYNINFGDLCKNFTGIKISIHNDIDIQFILLDRI